MSPEEQQERRELVEDLYNDILRVANRILHNCKNFNISILAKENPTYGEIAKQMREVCGLMRVVSGDIDSDHMAGKAREYAFHIGLIAEAIEANDEVELNRLTSELDRRSFL